MKRLLIVVWRVDWDSRWYISESKEISRRLFLFRLEIILILIRGVVEEFKEVYVFCVVGGGCSSCCWRGEG